MTPVQKHYIQFALHINMAIDVYPLIMDELTRAMELNASTKYKARFTAKGKEKRDLERMYKENVARGQKRVKSFKKQLEDMVIKFDNMEGAFANKYQSCIDEMYNLDEELLKKF